MMDEHKLRTETLRRRTFAIISHPDAGKTTLTEKLLLHGGAIHLAGAVKARGAQRHVTSDWMELERQRGISVTSSVLQFEHQGHRINLLDTPGHQDFSEDTYRTLAAADSAVTEVGVDEFLEAFARLAPPPGRSKKVDGEQVLPEEPRFSGFVFKIQANMDPAHRDRLAFLRVCSGRFYRGMEARLAREEKPVRLSMPHQLFGADRQVIEEAWPGDVIGLFDTGTLRIGDTLSEGPAFEYAELPRFSPEIFARVRAKDALKRKQLEKGLLQLSQEGAIQVFALRDGGLRDPILGAVGALQLEVLQYRLSHEYGAEIALDRLPYTVARWIQGTGFDPGSFEQEVDALCVVDRDQNPLALFKSEWNLSYAQGRHPQWTFSPTAMTKSR